MQYIMISVFENLILHFGKRKFRFVVILPITHKNHFKIYISLYLQKVMDISLRMNLLISSLSQYPPLSAMMNKAVACAWYHGVTEWRIYMCDIEYNRFRLWKVWRKTKLQHPSFWWSTLIGGWSIKTPHLATLSFM